MQSVVEPQDQLVNGDLRIAVHIEGGTGTQQVYAEAPPIEVPGSMVKEPALMVR